MTGVQSQVLLEILADGRYFLLKKNERVFFLLKSSRRGVQSSLLHSAARGRMITEAAE